MLGLWKRSGFARSGGLGALVARGRHLGPTPNTLHYSVVVVYTMLLLLLLRYYLFFNWPIFQKSPQFRLGPPICLQKILGLLVRFLTSQIPFPSCNHSVKACKRQICCYITSWNISIQIVASFWIILHKVVVDTSAVCTFLTHGVYVCTSPFTKYQSDQMLRQTSMKCMLANQSRWSCHQWPPNEPKLPEPQLHAPPPTSTSPTPATSRLHTPRYTRHLASCVTSQCSSKEPSGHVIHAVAASITNNLRLKSAERQYCWQYRFYHDVRKYSFIPRIINIWISLPDFVVNDDSINIFKSRLDKYWINQDIVFDYTLHSWSCRNWRPIWVYK